MAYRVVSPFADKCDDNHVYKLGDYYPRSGFKASAARIAELSSCENNQNAPLIAEVKTETKEDKANDNSGNAGKHHRRFNNRTAK